MKRIFSRQRITGSVAEVFRYDYHEALNDCMDRVSSGLYHSNGRLIDLSRSTVRKDILLPGWDLGKGNILTLPWKVCECVVSIHRGNYIFAYTVWRHDSLELVVSQISMTLWEDESVNGINHKTELFHISRGFNSRLSSTGDKLYWRQYDSASSTAKFNNCEYDYTTGTFVSREEVEQNIPSLSCIAEVHDGRSCIVRLPKSGIWCIHIMPFGHNAVSPAIVVCPGGPYLPVPDLKNLPDLYGTMAERGYHVIIPLRRGICISKEWENALAGNYGKADVDDIVTAAKEIVDDKTFNIDPQRVALYGASYGGYSSLLICGKHNGDLFFKSVVSHCGIYDLAEYPVHSSGNAQAIMNEYGSTTQYESYVKNVRFINPANYVGNWNVPVLLVHTIDDTTTWFGQSVKAYNAALEGHNVSLVLAEGGHSYQIESEKEIYDEIIRFYDNSLRREHE